jgi:hypothetical protein
MVLTASLVVILTMVSYAREWRDVSICLREVRVNGHARMELDHRIGALLQPLPRRSTVLAYTGAHSGAFELANVPLRRTINEGNFAIWDSALHDPGSSADYVVACDGDPVAIAVARNSVGLAPVASIDVQGQPHTVLYKSELWKR